jgi:hypothetical protein
VSLESDLTPDLTELNESILSDGLEESGDALQLSRKVAFQV